MSYRQEEQNIQKKLRRIRWIVFAVVFFIIVVVCIFSACVPPATWKYYFYLPKVTERREGELRLHFLDVGQGDCTLLELPDGKTALIDGGNGEEKTSTAIMRYLNALHIDYLDFVILTHVDADHCGGLSTVIKYKDVGTVFYPKEDNVTVNMQYSAFYTALAEKGCEKIVSRGGLSVSSREESLPYSLCFLWPYEEGTSTSSNESSAVLLLEYAGRKALFMGDAPESVGDRLTAYSQVGLLYGGADVSSVDILKVSHHGADAGSPSFLSYTHPKKAIISCGKGNPYGHPTQETFDRLTEVGTEILRTDELGNVAITWSLDSALAK